MAQDAVQVHAEASTFADGLSKSEAYSQVIEQAKALFEDQRNWVNVDCFVTKDSVLTFLRSGMINQIPMTCQLKHQKTDLEI